MIYDSALIFMELIYWYFCINYAFYRAKEDKYLLGRKGIYLVFSFFLYAIIAPIFAVYDLFKRVKK